MAEIFKTNISDKEEVDKVIRLFQSSWQHLQVSFDLDDCDRILRVESKGEPIDPQKLVEFLALHRLEVELIE